MASQDSISSLITLPLIPVKHHDFVRYISANQQTPIPELLEPYKAYDNKMREVFAQQPNHPAIKQPNVVPIYTYVAN